MKTAITGASGFVGQALVARLADREHRLKCLRREGSDVSPLKPWAESIEWFDGDLKSLPEMAGAFLQGCDSLVHSAFWRTGRGFRGTEGDLVEFAQTNIVGTLALFQAAVEAKLDRIVFVSTCAVHEVILDDRALDESHPLWPLTHYGAHKAALEKFVHSYGLGMGVPICAIRPTGIYGIQSEIEHSKWFSLVKDIVEGVDVEVSGGGKEVHVADVAKGIELLLETKQPIAGQAFACYERYISKHEVATIAKRIAGSTSIVGGEPKTAMNEIDTQRIRGLGMKFGGNEQLETTIEEMVLACQG